MWRRAVYVVVLLATLTLWSTLLIAQGSRVTPLQRRGVKVWLEKSCFESGETLVIHVQSQRDGYLTVYDLIPEGQATALFPNAYSPDNFIHSGEVYNIPPVQAPYHFQVRIPPNVSKGCGEIIWAIVTEEELNLLELSYTYNKAVAQINNKLLNLQGWWAAASASFQYGPCGTAEELEQTTEPAQQEINEINQAIQRAGASWIARKTTLTELTKDDQKRLCGTFVKELPPSKELSMARRSVQLPAHLDWRDVNANDWTTPIKDQGLCGSCWDFAVVGVMESQLDIASLDPTDRANEILSEQYILSNCEPCVYRYVSGGCEGGYPDEALNFLSKRGTVTAACFPYIVDDMLGRYDTCGCLPQKIAYWGWAWDKDRLSSETIKTAMYKYGPIASYMTVYKYFMDYKEGVYQHVAGKKLGGHAVVIVGWDDDKQAWICKNSWGPGWGEKGWFRIKWGDCDINDLLLVAPVPSTKGVKNLYEYVKGR